MPVSHPSRLELEMWHVGEPNAVAASHLADCPRCREFLAALDDERARLLGDAPPEDFVRDLRRRLDATPTRWRWLHHWPPFAVAAAALAACLILAPLQPAAARACIASASAHSVRWSSASADSHRGTRMRSSQSTVKYMPSPSRLMAITPAYIAG